MEVIDINYESDSCTYIVKTQLGVIFSHIVHVDMPLNQITKELREREKEIDKQPNSKNIY
ncbi:hypothetical protein BU107_13575 [Staphylococcus xylosus]|uniref:hypothetical protein n=1 Tax=Staphylococcus xylosus TaxID=1288 RepID=UPI000E680190|nr:hypothetical protein [Staphylococcus xylosus]RIM84447.1 hypothetical protein BU107_13575 [Staphylococcus xylosus]